MIETTKRKIQRYGFETSWIPGRIIANKGRVSIVTIIAPKPPIATILIASFALPSRTILWPGSMDRAVPSSGTPSNVEGINSRIAWDIASDARNTQITSELVN